MKNLEIFDVKTTAFLLTLFISTTLWPFLIVYFDPLSAHDYDRSRMLQVSVLLLLTIFSTSRPINDFKKLIAILAISSISSALATSSLYAFQELLLMILIFELAHSAIHYNEAQIQSLRKITSYAAVIFSLYYSIQFYITLENTAIFFENIKNHKIDQIQTFPFVENARYVNAIQTIIFFIPWLIIAKEENRVFTVLTCLASTLSLSLLITSGARASLLSILIGFLFLIYFYKKKIILKIGLVIFILSVVMHTATNIYLDKRYQLQFARNITIEYSRTIGENPTSGRLALWKESIDIISKNPLIGIGPMHFANQKLNRSAHPHNSVLMISSEYGLIVLILLSITFGREILSSFKYRIKESLSGGLIAAATLATFVDSLLSGTLVYPISQLWLIVLGMLFLVPTKKEYDFLTKKAIFILFATCLLALTFTTHNIMLSNQIKKEFHQPRYWLYGQLKIDR